MESSIPTPGSQVGNPGYTTTPVAIEGEVITSRSSWRGGRIVTESVIRASDGTEHTVSQPGGTVEDIGQIRFPSPAILAPGDQVSLVVDATRPGDARSGATMPILDVLTLERAAKASTANGPTELKYLRTTNDHLIPLYWAYGCIKITYHDAGTSHVAGDMEFDVIDQVFDTWRNVTQSCSYLTFDRLGRDNREVGMDRVNMIVFRDDVWGGPGCPEDPNQCYPDSAAAITTVSYINSESSDRSGEIVDADIEMNAVGFAISVNGVTEGNPNLDLSDLANTLTHEVGHLMGLEHTCFISPPRYTDGTVKPFPEDQNGNVVGYCSENDPLELKETTMYPTQSPGETIKATPEADDIAAICDIYSLVDDPGVCAVPDSPTTRSCACHVGAKDSGVPVSALGPLLLLGLGLLWRRRARLAGSSRTR